jgi:hypothetical protein
MVGEVKAWTVNRVGVLQGGCLMHLLGVGGELQGGVNL